MLGWLGGIPSVVTSRGRSPYAMRRNGQGHGQGHGQGRGGTGSHVISRRPEVCGLLGATR